MLALTIAVGSAVLLVALVAAVRALRRASRRIDDILRDELESTDDTDGDER